MPEPSVPRPSSETVAVAVQADLLAHEFNNLLTTILGYANLLARSFDKSDPRRADVDEIIDGVQRASRLVQQLKTLSRAPERSTDARVDSPQPTARASNPGMILVVDDERPVRYLVRTILTRAGYEVAEAASADEADTWLAGHTGALDLLISDIALPRSSGPDLLRRLRDRRSGLKVLFMSGYSDDEIRRDPQIDPEAPFVQKPFSAEALTEHVRRMLG